VNTSSRPRRPQRAGTSPQPASVARPRATYLPPGPTSESEPLVDDHHPSLRNGAEVDGSTAGARAFGAAVDRLSLDPAPRGDRRTLFNRRVLARAGADDLDAAQLTEAHVIDLATPGVSVRSGEWQTSGMAVSAAGAIDVRPRGARRCRWPGDGRCRCVRS